MPTFIVSLVMLFSVGLMGNAQASCCPTTRLFDLSYFQPTGLFQGNTCCNKSSWGAHRAHWMPAHHRHVHYGHNHGRTYWTNWQPYYYQSSCGQCGVRYKKSCLVDRCSGKVVRCVKRCAH